MESSEAIVLTVAMTRDVDVRKMGEGANSKKVRSVGTNHGGTASKSRAGLLDVARARCIPPRLVLC